MDNLMFGVQLANILARCSSHPQGAKVKQGAKMLVLYRRGSCACAPMQFGAEVKALTSP